MFSSQFDNAATSGGGFMSQPSQFNDSTPPTKGRESQGIRPVTVKQISEASQSGDDKSNFLLDGVDVTNVTLVGIVSEKSERVTDVGFTLDDGTGRIACKRWVNDAFDKKEMEDIQDGMYARLVGHLNSFQGQTQIVAFSLNPVTNFDEVTFHYTQCIFVHLQNSGKKPLAVTSSEGAHIKIESSKPQATSSNQVSEQFGAGLKGSDQLVLDYLQQPSNLEQEKGIHKDELLRQLKIPVKNLTDAIRKLEEEGLIYSTIDEYHYKSTAGG